MQPDGAVSDLFAGARKRVSLDCGAWLLGGFVLREAMNMLVSAANAEDKNCHAAPQGEGLL